MIKKEKHITKNKYNILQFMFFFTYQNFKKNQGGKEEEGPTLKTSLL